LPGIEIVEKHEHSNHVPYVPKGQDAAVSYGSVDFKFKNHNGYNIKILAEATDDEVIIKILKV
jgi:vancomycin resistance protein YoaR